MKATHNGKTYDLKIQTEFTEYNCSTKMFGRVKAICVYDGKNIPVTEAIGALFDANKDGIIAEWANSLNSPSTYTQLRSGGQNKIFPNDSGTYLPNVLLYADNVYLYKGNGYKWYNNARYLVHELQTGKHGFIVHEFPLFANRFYGHGRLSRVWAVTPPGAVSYLVDPANKEKSQLKAALKNIKDNKESMTAEDIAEVRKILGV